MSYVGQGLPKEVSATTIDLDGASDKLILDTDGDTTISADTDDQIDIKIAGADDFQFTANTFTAQSGSTIAAQALTATTVTASGIIKTDDTTEATSTTDGSLQTDGGLSVVKDAVFGDDIKLLSDAAVIHFGADSDVTMTHVADAGLAVSATGNLDTLKLISTDADANAGPVLVLHRDGSSPANDDQIGRINFAADSDAASETDFAIIKAYSAVVGHGSESGQLTISTRLAGTEKQRITMGTGSTIFNDDSADYDLRVESDAYSSALMVDAAENAVFIGTTSFYDTNAIGTVRSGSSSNATLHISNNSGSYTGNCFRIALDTEEASNNFFATFTDTNDTNISFRGDGNAFADGSFSGGGADFAVYFESTDGSAIAIGKTVVLDNGKVRASTNSDSASDIVGVVRAIKAVAVVGNTAWSRWKGKYKVDDYGVPLLEEYTITEWDQIVAEDADDLEVTYKGEKKKLPQYKGDTIHHSYATDKIPSELTVPSDAKVLTVDADGKKYKRKILNESYDASKEYVSREFRDEWNLIGLTGQVTMTKGQKTGDRWIKMRDISDTVEEWLIR